MDHRTKLVGALLALLAAPALAGVIVLDDFDADPNDDALGARDFSSGISADPFGQGGSAFIDTGFHWGDDAGALIMNSGIGVQQNARLDYDGFSSPLDLSGAGVLAFDFLQVDQDFGIRIVMIGQGGGKAVIDQLHVGAGAQQTVLFDILADSDFTNIDISAITDVEIVFNSSFRDGDDFVRVASLDFILTGIRAVPTPSAMAFWGLGGLAAARRRR